LYTFSEFIEPDYALLLTHADESSRIWHERFGHLNFKYMKQLSKHKLFDGLTDIHFSKGVCEGCVLKKHPLLKENSLRTGRSPQRARLLTLRQKVLIMVTDFLLDLGGLVCEKEGEKKYLLPVFVPARSELSSNLSLFDRSYRQTKYDHFLLYQD
jgi:hypothetical protein